MCAGGGWSPGGPGVGAVESGHVEVRVSFVVGCGGGYGQAWGYTVGRVGSSRKGAGGEQTVHAWTYIISGEGL